MVPCPASCSSTAVPILRVAGTSSLTQIAERAPHLRVLAVDLPGRPEHPGSPDSLTLNNYADVVVNRNERAWLG